MDGSSDLLVRGCLFYFTFAFWGTAHADPPVHRPPMYQYTPVFPFYSIIIVLTYFCTSFSRHIDLRTKDKKSDADRGLTGCTAFFVAAMQTPASKEIRSSLQTTSLTRIVAFLPFFYMSAVIDLLPEFSNSLQSIPLERSVRPYRRKGTMHRITQNLPCFLLCICQDSL
jgi:hypothetical protein